MSASSCRRRSSATSARTASNGGGTISGAGSRSCSGAYFLHASFMPITVKRRLARVAAAASQAALKGCPTRVVSTGTQTRPRASTCSSPGSRASCPALRAVSPVSNITKTWSRTSTSAVSIPTFSSSAA